MSLSHRETSLGKVPALEGHCEGHLTSSYSMSEWSEGSQWAERALPQFPPAAGFGL